MKAVLWYFIYAGIGVGVWAFFKVTTHAEREWLTWHGITLFLVILAPVWFFTELLPFLRSML